MNRSLPSTKRREHGSVAIEFIVVMLFIVVAAARALAQAELAELNPGTYTPVVYVFCDSGPCIPFQSLPKMVSVYISMRVQDPFLTPITSLFTDDSGPIAIQIDATGRSYYLNK